MSDTDSTHDISGDSVGALKLYCRSSAGPKLTSGISDLPTRCPLTFTGTNCPGSAVGSMPPCVYVRGAPGHAVAPPPPPLPPLPLPLLLPLPLPLLLLLLPSARQLSPWWPPPLLLLLLSC